MRSVSPQLRKGDSQRLATAVVAMLEGLSLLRQPDAPRSIPQPSHVFEMVLRLVRAGLENGWPK